jgi:hypothetical protein
MKARSVFAMLIASFSLMQSVDALALNFEEIKLAFKQQVGVNIQGAGLVPMNQPIAAKVGNATRLNALFGSPALNSGNGDAVSITFTSEKEFEMLFKKQGMKAKLHFEGSGHELKALVDWLLAQK